MYNVELYGIDPLYEPLSSAFIVDILNQDVYFQIPISTITKISFSIQGIFVDNFSVLDQNYAVILLKFNIRFDYLDFSNSVSYQFFNFHKLVNICTDCFVVNKNISIYPEVLDSVICDISNNDVNLSIVFACSLGI